MKEKLTCIAVGLLVMLVLTLTVEGCAGTSRKLKFQDMSEQDSVMIFKGDVFWRYKSSDLDSISLPYLDSVLNVLRNGAPWDSIVVEVTAYYHIEESVRYGNKRAESIGKYFIDSRLKRAKIRSRGTVVVVESAEELKATETEIKAFRHNR